MAHKQSVRHKRVWEIDCLSMDAVLAASFDWRELHNHLRTAGCGIEIPRQTPAHLAEMRVQNHAHHLCHGENGFSIWVERFLNRLYADLIIRVRCASAEQLKTVVSHLDFGRAGKMGGLIWAIGSDAREEMTAVRRLFHQRMQVRLLRGSRFD